MHTSREILAVPDPRAAGPARPVDSSNPTGSRPVGPVVVGVDGSLGVLKAVSWAAAEAARRGADLDLVRVASAGDEPLGHARALLHRAVGTAAAVAPGLAMTMIREAGPAGPGLLAHAARACLLVVGVRRRTDGGPSGDRTVAHLLAHAPCPVAVVPPRRTGAWASTPSGRPVLAGVTDAGARSRAGVDDLVTRSPCPVVVAHPTRRPAPLPLTDGGVLHDHEHSDLVEPAGI